MPHKVPRAKPGVMTEYRGVGGEHRLEYPHKKKKLLTHRKNNGLEAGEKIKIKCTSKNRLFWTKDCR